MLCPSPWNSINFFYIQISITRGTIAHTGTDRSFTSAVGGDSDAVLGDEEHLLQAYVLPGGGGAHSSRRT
jgi:hypothetical protein